MNKFEHLILKATCFKDLFPSAIDLILTNHKQKFMKLNVYAIGISDHHKMIFLVLREIFAIGKLKIVFYRWCKKYDQDSINKALQNKISQPDLQFEEFHEIF